MPVEQKSRVFTGDSFPVTYECRKPDPDDPNNPKGIPAYPTSGYARVVQTDAAVPDFLPIGGPGVFQAPASIDGNIISYTFPETFTLPGTYKIFVTAVFPGGSTLTEDRILKVLDILPTTS